MDTKTVQIGPKTFRIYYSRVKQYFLELIVIWEPIFEPSPRRGFFFKREYREFPDCFYKSKNMNVDFRMKMIVVPNPQEWMRIQSWSTVFDA